MRRLNGLERVVVAGFALVALVALPGVPAPVQALVGAAFFLAVPGLAWVRLLPVDGLVEQGAVVVAVSLALDVLVAEALVYVGVAAGSAVVVGLAVLTLGGLAWSRRSRAADEALEVPA